MAKGKVSTQPDLPPAEVVLIDVLRMILRGRADEVPVRIRKMVSTAAGRRAAKLSESGRAAIALLLSEESARSGPERRLRVAPSQERLPRATVETVSESDLVQNAPAPVLEEQDFRALEHVVREYRERDRLSSSGLHPTRTILLSGAPGVGKSMTISFLAAQLGQPLIRVEPADVIGSFLGESARMLSATFDRARDGGAILALDEIDALAKRRDDIYDVGEFKRFVTTLLVELDRWEGDVPLIAATNHLDLLDPALERRFELHVRLQRPQDKSRLAILEQTLLVHGLTVEKGTLDALVMITEGSTGADLAGLVRQAARRVVLDEESIERALLMAALPDDPRLLDRRTKERFAAVAQNRAHLSTRQIGELLGCSHTAARRLAQAGAGRTAASSS